MSKARAKGTSWEVELLPQLRLVFGEQVERAPLKGTLDKGDFMGVPWLHEAKKTDVPHFLQWAKTATRKVGDRWAIIWSGDRRKGDGPFVMLPLDHYLDLAEGALRRGWAPGTEALKNMMTIGEMQRKIASGEWALVDL